MHAAYFWPVKVSSNAHSTLMDCEFRSNAWDNVSHKLNITYNLFSSFCKICFFLFFCGRELMAVTSGKQIYLQGNKWWKHVGAREHRAILEGNKDPTGRPSYKNSKQTNSSLFNIFLFKNCKSKKRYTKSGGHWIPSSVLGRHDFWIRPYQIWIPKFIRWLKNIYEDYPKAWRSWIT